MIVKQALNAATKFTFLPEKILEFKIEGTTYFDYSLCTYSQKK